MQDMPAATLGDVQGRLRRPKISCGECEATGSDIRLFVYAADDRGAAIRVLCTGCGSSSDFAAKWVRPQSISAGVHAGVAKAPQAAAVRWHSENVTQLRKKRGPGRPSKYATGDHPWVKAGIAKSTWYRRQLKG